LINQVAETLVSLDIPEPELDQLRREILRLGELQPGLDARELQQHLVQTELAAAVDALLSPSVDAGFLLRCPDPISAGREWAHVIRMLNDEDWSTVTAAGSALETELTAELWERFQTARERALDQHPIGADDQL
jgi:hypothetical protein